MGHHDSAFTFKLENPYMVDLTSEQKKENNMEIGVYFPSSKQNVSAIETLWIPIAYLIQVDLYMQL